MMKDSEISIVFETSDNFDLCKYARVIVFLMRSNALSTCSFKFTGIAVHSGNNKGKRTLSQIEFHRELRNG